MRWALAISTAWMDRSTRCRPNARCGLPNLHGFPELVRSLGADPRSALERYGIDPQVIRTRIILSIARPLSTCSNTAARY